MVVTRSVVIGVLRSPHPCRVVIDHAGARVVRGRAERPGTQGRSSRSAAGARRDHGPRPDREPDLEYRLVDWVYRGLTTAEQAAGIRAAKARPSGELTPRVDHGPSAGSRVGHVLGDLGEVLVVVAAVLITARD